MTRFDPSRVPSALTLPALLVLLACGPVAATSPAPEAASGRGIAPAPLVVPMAAADTGVVRVSASASVLVAADQARLRFAVETREADATQAARANARVMGAVLAAVRRELGEGGEVATEGYALNPEYSRPEPGAPRSRSIVAYQALNNVSVTVAELDRVARVLDAAVGAGANRVAQLTFVASDTREARLQAMREATAKATEEARILASALGAELGPVLEVSVSPEDQGGGPMMRQAMMESADVATPVEAGSSQVSVTVHVTWRVETAGR